ncbi:DNA topoisomerase [Bacillus sp. JCM 19034]|uniref:type IA DNA topoisomerase n=1 Tax=Bacillus sp. JCM 19034 TaxID=1481928 RepID=UPI00351D911F
MYALIVKRLIAAHYPPAITLYTTVHSLVDSRAEFMTKGKEQLEEGWRRLFNGTNENVNKDVDQKLPHINENEIGTVANLSINKGETQPPNRYTEGNLITLMKTAGKHIDNAQLEKVLAQTEGLGTEATRAGIINLLKARNYIQIKHNQVYATKKGMILIEALGESILTSPSMTAKWEQRLSEISSGTASPQNFIGQVKLLSQKLVTDAKEQATKWSFDQNTLKQLAPNSVPATYKKISKTPLGKCKLCNGTIIDLGKFYGCSNYKLSNCTFSISKKILGKTISKANLKKLLEANETNLIKGFKKKERTFDAKLTWNEKEKKTEFRFMNKIK